MTWVLAPLLVGGASTLVATLVRAAARATASDDPGPVARSRTPAAGADLNVARPGRRVLGVATPRGGPPWNHPSVNRT